MSEFQPKVVVDLTDDLRRMIKADMPVVKLGLGFKAVVLNRDGITEAGNTIKIYIALTDEVVDLIDGALNEKMRGHKLPGRN